MFYQHLLFLVAFPLTTANPVYYDLDDFDLPTSDVKSKSLFDSWVTPEELDHNPVDHLDIDSHVPGIITTFPFSKYHPKTIKDTTL